MSLLSELSDKPGPGVPEGKRDVNSCYGGAHDIPSECAGLSQHKFYLSVPLRPSDSNGGCGSRAFGLEGAVSI